MARNFALSASRSSAGARPHPESSHGDKTCNGEGDDPASQRLVPRRSPFHAFLNGGSSYSGFVTGVKPVPRPTAEIAISKRT
jgi:hypothetical protein